MAQQQDRLCVLWRWVLELGTATQRFLDHRRLANRAAGTLRLYTRQLGLWAHWRALAGTYTEMVEDVTIEELRAFFTYLRADHIPYGSETSARPARGGHLAESGVAAHWRTLRAFWRFCANEEWLTERQVRYFQRIDPPHVKKAPRPAADRATVDRLLRAAGDGTDEESARNRAILLLLGESGMRIAELCSMTDRQADIRARRAKIKGKGEKWRAVFWQADAAGALARYLLLRRGTPYSASSDAPLFRGCSWRNKGGAVTPDLVRACLKRIAAECGVTLPHGAPIHFLRHGFAHSALDNGADISEVSQLLGHASITTTMEYLRDQDDRLHDAYDRIFRQRSSPRARRPGANGDDGKAEINRHG